MDARVINGLPLPSLDLPPIPEGMGTVTKPKWNVQDATKFWEFGQSMYDKGNGQAFGTTLEPGVMVTAALNGAAAGAAAGGVGAAVGAAIAVVVEVIKFLTGDRPPRQWVDAGPGVHAWFTAYGPQEFLDWVRTTNPGALASLSAINRTFVGYALEKWGVVLVPGMRTYSGIDDGVYLSLCDASVDTWAADQIGRPTSFAPHVKTYIEGYPGRPWWPGGLQWAAEMYRNLGIDYPASAAVRSSGRTGAGVVQIVPTKLADEETGQGAGQDDAEAASAGSGSGVGVGLAALAAFLLLRN